MKARALGRSIADFEKLNDAEQKLLKSCRRGDDENGCVISDERPNGQTPANTIRAGFLRFLILGGDNYNAVHERGVRVHGAWIEGKLDLEGVCSTSDVAALCCWFDQRPALSDAHIKGNLVLNGSRVPGLDGDGLTCDAGFFCNEKFLADGEVRLLGAQIGRTLEFTNGTLNGLSKDGKPGGDALSADRIVVKGNVFLDREFNANGAVRLPGAAIGGNLLCRAAKFNALLEDGIKLGTALNADRINVKGNLILDGKFTANGTVSLLGANVGADLECTGANFNGPLKDGKSGGIAMDADGIEVKGDVYLNNEFTANGEVRLLGAIVGGILVCGGATFNGPLKDRKPNGDALSADGINVKGDVFLDDGFVANGEVRFLGAVIGGDLACTGATLNTGDRYSLNASGMSVAGIFYFRRLKAPAGDVNLGHARVRVLADDKDAWGENLNLGGFTYERISGASPKEARTRLEWLDKQRLEWSGKVGRTGQFSPQPWLQLRKVLRETGHAEDARVVGIAYEERRLDCGQIKDFVPRVFHRIYGIFTGYGYRPMWLFGWSVSIWLICSLIYYVAACLGDFSATNFAVYESPYCRHQLAVTEPAPAINQVYSPPCDPGYPVFSPIVYSLNVFLPVVELGEEAAWAPITEPFSPTWWRNLTQPFTNFGNFVQLVIWLETLFGWIAGLLLVAVVSGLARKQDES